MRRGSYQKNLPPRKISKKAIARHNGIDVSRSDYKDLEESYSGICVNCLSVRHGQTEPDARKYHCSTCDTKNVYGMSELILMGCLNICCATTNELQW